MTEDNISPVEVKKRILPTILAWMFALAACIGLISFLIWQPKIARAMSERKSQAMIPDYRHPQT